MCKCVCVFVLSNVQIGQPCTLVDTKLFEWSTLVNIGQHVFTTEAGGSTASGDCFS